MKKIPALLAIVAVAVIAYSMTSWGKKSTSNILSSSNSTTETRKVSDFEKIEASGIFQIDVTYGSEESIEIEAPDDIQNSVKLKAKAGTLKIELDKNNYTIQNGIKVHIKTAKLNGFELSGATTVVLNNPLNDSQLSINSSGAVQFVGEVNVKVAEIELDGASNVKLTGSASSADLEMSGASKLKGYDFEVGDLDLDLSGASMVKVTSLKSIRGDVSGASSLNYKGDPSVHRVNSSGASKVNKQ